MLIVESYGVAVALCVVTMVCWGSWANTQKLTGKEWRFQLFYWDYSIGVFLLALALALTAGALAEDREKCFAAGMDDHLGKPFDPKDLAAKLVRWRAAQQDRP